MLSKLLDVAKLTQPNLLLIRYFWDLITNIFLLCF
nr:MAG TPA: hypothetical protein [Caudoviricetes sp.]